MLSYNPQNISIIYIYLNYYLCFYLLMLFCRSLLFLAVFYSCLYIDLFVALFSMKSLFFFCLISFMILYNMHPYCFNLYFFPDYKDSMFLYICLNMFLFFYPISSSFIFWLSKSSFRLFPPFCFFCYNLMALYVLLLYAYFPFCLSLYLFDLLFKRINH